MDKKLKNTVIIAKNRQQTGYHFDHPFISLKPKVLRLEQRLRQHRIWVKRLRSGLERSHVQHLEHLARHHLRHARRRGCHARRIHVAGVRFFWRKRKWRLRSRIRRVFEEKKVVWGRWRYSLEILIKKIIFLKKHWVWIGNIVCQKSTWCVCWWSYRFCKWLAAGQINYQLIGLLLGNSMILFIVNNCAKSIHNNQKLYIIV